ncbi:hypothetical protein GHO45_03845 [Pseudomonas sp. FSL R10-0765]|uniref:hypothetical protein n=1 Tax=Pseudomonas sp. FSL R10-0765 TaxID=2662195 RepID=UPI001297E416|nr:hypothetical protein [Pseudomonas sp. FSL R10-0765]MQT40066.1 hypothetical protein [Pseudomonas sp. FSL R10-0765]
MSYCQISHIAFAIICLENKFIIIMKKIASSFITFTILALGIYAIAHFAMYLKELMNQSQANPTGPHFIILIALFAFGLIGYATAFLIGQIIIHDLEV